MKKDIMIGFVALVLVMFALRTAVVEHEKNYDFTRTSEIDL